MNNKVLNKDALKAWILSKMVTLTNSLLATTPGVSAMDAAQGPVIQGQIDKINSNLGGLSFSTTEDGQPGWKDGADTVHPFSQTKIVMEYLKATPYPQTGGGGTFSYTAERDCTIHIRGCGANSGAISGSGISSSAGNYCHIYTGDIKLSKGQTYSVSCSIPSNGGIVLVGYIT